MNDNLFDIIPEFLPLTEKNSTYIKLYAALDDHFILNIYLDPNKKHETLIMFYFVDVKANNAFIHTIEIEQTSDGEFTAFIKYMCPDAIILKSNTITGIETIPQLVDSVLPILKDYAQYLQSGLGLTVYID